MSAEGNPVNKLLIKQRGQELAETVRHELQVLPADGDPNSQEGRIQLRTRIIEKADSDPANLTRFERSLLAQYTEKRLMESDRADRWLDNLPALSLGSAEFHVKRPPLTGFFILLSKVLGPVVPYLPSVEDSRRYVDWNRANRPLLRSAGIAVIFLITGVDGLVYELILRPATPNWGPPVALTAVGALACIMSAMLAKRVGSIKPSALSGLILIDSAAFALLLFALMQLKAPMALLVAALFSGVFASLIGIWKLRNKNQIVAR